MKTAAIILAAGFSSRMGAPNKLLLPVAGVPILASVTRAVLEVIDTVPLIVLGHEADRVHAEMEGLPVDMVTNEDPSRGQASSVRLGLSRAPEADATLVVLGDQPFLTADALRALIQAHAENGAERITVPVDGDTRGNPVVIPRALQHSILQSGANVGCGGFTRKNPELTRPFPTTDPVYFFDVDTPEDLERARAFPAGVAV